LRVLLVHVAEVDFEGGISKKTQNGRNNSTLIENKVRIRKRSGPGAAHDRTFAGSFLLCLAVMTAAISRNCLKSPPTASWRSCGNASDGEEASPPRSGLSQMAEMSRAGPPHRGRGSLSGRTFGREPVDPGPGPGGPRQRSLHYSRGRFPRLKMAPRRHAKGQHGRRGLGRGLRRTTTVPEKGKGGKEGKRFRCRAAEGNRCLLFLF